jgi:predicted transcriptional regulator of viral defense system
MKYLATHDFIATDEAKRLGINPMMLSRLARDQELFRIERGLYTKDTAWLTDPLKKYLPICTAIPEAVVAGLSALTYYDLTDEEERQVWISLPSHKKLKNPRYRVIRPSGRNYKLGVERHSFGKREVRIYDMEKTVVDAFKYLSEEAALKVLKAYLKRPNKDVTKLCEYGRKLKKPLDDIVRVLMAEE